MNAKETLFLAAIPAAVGTYVLDRIHGEKDARKTPVLGFLHIQAGICFPITAMGGGGLTLGRVLVTADGFVSDPSYGVVCGNIEEWMRLSGTEAYWTREAETKPAQPEARGDALDPSRPTEDEIETDRAEAAARRIPDKPAAPVKPPRIFKSNSYWQFQKNPKKHDNAWDCVWMIPGGQPVPPEKGSPYVKITGEEYKALKKAGWPEADPRGDPPAGQSTAADDDNDDLL